MNKIWRCGSIVLITIFVFVVGGVLVQSPQNTIRAFSRSSLIPTSQAVGPFIATELLGCPTNNSVTVNVIPDRDLEVFYEYGTAPADYSNQTPTMTHPGDAPFEVVIDGLQSNTRYYYRMRYREPGAPEFTAGDEHSFLTRRAPGSTFTFTVVSDSHLGTDKHCDPDLYAQTMLNVREDNPDFHFDLGDTFRSSKVTDPDYDSIAQLYIDQRPFFDVVGHSAPVFLVIGNHEMELGWVLDGTADNLAVWSTIARKLYFPNPTPDTFYTGSTTVEEFVGLRENYYAFEWGDALFVALDPWWYTTSDPKDNGDTWDWTIGNDQYYWFKNTLEQSDATFKFVFTHHVIGTCRGGTEWADFYEMGGRNKSGVWEFDVKRPGWEKPVHQLLVENRATILFQGHDHIFVKQERDGVLYVTLPMPGDRHYPEDPENVAYNNWDAFAGVKRANSGHVRVTVSSSTVNMDYVYAFLPEDENEHYSNGQIAYSYTIGPSAISNPSVVSYDLNNVRKRGKSTSFKKKTSYQVAQKPKRDRRDRFTKHNSQKRGNNQKMKSNQDSEKEQPHGAGKVSAPGAELKKIGDTFKFTEGPAVDAEGNLFFTDIRANCIHKWSTDGSLSIFRENSGGANGLFFARDGKLFVCEGDNGRITSIDPKGNVTVVADTYNGLRFNKPNDLWIDPKGGIYFSDPIYGKSPRYQDGEHVYYVSPDRKTILRVVDDMVRPNGLIGTIDGKVLYITDHGAKKTYRYTINEDGTLSGKSLFVEIGADGMTLDVEGNLYLTEADVLVYDSAGNLIEKIEIPERSTNVTFGGKEGKTLYITARQSVYSIETRVKGVYVPTAFTQ